MILQSRHFAFSALLLLGIFSNAQTTAPSKVELKSVDGQYHFFVNEKKFDVKGAGSTYNLPMLKKCGGNSFRTWGAWKGKQVLDSAKKYDFMVAMGLGLGQQLHGFDYNDTAAVRKQFEKIKSDVDSLKNHPNLLCWVAGNELNLMSGEKELNLKVYDALKQVVDYIHKTDPNHPVTTAFAGVDKKNIKAMLERCPDIDIVSLQVYADLIDIEKNAKEAGITKPYMVTEYGARGHWQSPWTEWKREIEETSTEKANGMANRIQKAFINNTSGLCLGGYVFIWGQKQERTPTWYGMFLKTGESTAVVDELAKYWSGSYPENRAPEVEKFELDGKKATDNIYLEAGKNYTAKLSAKDQNNDPLTYSWEILTEVIVRSQGGSREIEPDKVNMETVSSKNGELVFTAPKTAGEYRIFVYVYDGKNKVGTANIPFRVK
jgi:hypothetical protein